MLKLNSWPKKKKKKGIAILALCLSLLLFKKIHRRPVWLSLLKMQSLASTHISAQQTLLIVYGINYLMVHYSVLNIKSFC